MRDAEESAGSSAGAPVAAGAPDVRNVDCSPVSNVDVECFRGRLLPGGPFLDRSRVHWTILPRAKERGFSECRKNVVEN